MQYNLGQVTAINRFIQVTYYSVAVTRRDNLQKYFFSFCSIAFEYKYVFKAYDRLDYLVTNLSKSSGNLQTTLSDPGSIASYSLWFRGSSSFVLFIICSVLFRVEYLYIYNIIMHTITKSSYVIFISRMTSPRRPRIIYTP